MYNNNTLVSGFNGGPSGNDPDGNRPFTLIRDWQKHNVGSVYFSPGRDGRNGSKLPVRAHQVIFVELRHFTSDLRHPMHSSDQGLKFLIPCPFRLPAYMAFTPYRSNRYHYNYRRVSHSTPVEALPWFYLRVLLECFTGNIIWAADSHNSPGMSVRNQRIHVDMAVRCRAYRQESRKYTNDQKLETMKGRDRPRDGYNVKDRYMYRCRMSASKQTR
ncbi:hypothetical protein BDQ12DRAFT_709157 [Crucibulum laeve]|uniref:Uncharacterized protein n=1 Tax=Crucibulum laeve TaxID=68775 RepID=A0A5C3MDS0_9AGAR|nr:hypothetical protein BDQ12DRAFT_709157 [Crucibulum laeve]